MDKKVLNKIERKIDEVIKEHHGEVRVLIKNGHVYRTIKTFDELETKVVA